MSISTETDDEVLSGYGLRRGRYVLFTGRLVSEKGVHTLIEAFKSVPGDIKLVIVGDFPAANDYVRSLKSNADDRTAFMGYVYGRNYESLKNACMIYVHPSLLEGTSISLLGALGSGCCIVSSNLTENHEVAGDAAIYFERDSPESLSTVLNDLIMHPDWINAARVKALKRAKELFDWDRIALQYEEIYRELLGED